MSFLWRLFRSQKPPDDESVLAQLAADIQKRQTQLSEIRIRERNATMLVTLYTLAAWLVYLGVWYFGFVSGGKNARVRTEERVVRALPVFVGPIFILFIRRIVQIWYNRKGNAEEKSLQALMKSQRDKVEEIKKKTNFYSTRELLSRYDPSASAPSTPQRGPGGPSAGPGPQPNGKPHPSNVNPAVAALSASTGPGPRPSSSTGPPQPPPPSQPTAPRNRWFDALADILVGPEDTTPASQRFALICEKCFAHNGLVPEAAWADQQYLCPKCNHFNPSARSRRLLERSQGQSLPGSALMSPTSPTSPLSSMSIGVVSPGGSGEGDGKGDGAGTSARAEKGGEVRRRGKAGANGDTDGDGERMEVDSES